MGRMPGRKQITWSRPVGPHGFEARAHGSASDTLLHTCLCVRTTRSLCERFSRNLQDRRFPDHRSDLDPSAPPRRVARFSSQQTPSTLPCARSRVMDCCPRYRCSSRTERVLRRGSAPLLHPVGAYSRRLPTARRDTKNEMTVCEWSGERQFSSEASSVAFAAAAARRRSSPHTHNEGYPR